MAGWTRAFTRASSRPGRPTPAWRRFRQSPVALAALAALALFLLAGLLAPRLAPYDPLEQHYGNILQPGVWATGDWRFVLGTDGLGRDVLSRALYGARVSLLIGLTPLTFYLLIGGSIGMVAGFVGGRVDNLLMRLTDVVFAFPGLLFLILLQTSFRDTWLGQAADGLALLCLAIAVVGWEGVARLVRGQVLQVRQREYVEAARTLGAGPLWIMVKHILPNILPPLVVTLVLSVPGAMLAEAGLSFLGLGIRPPTPSWGAMLLEGQQTVFAQPSLILTPAVLIASVMLAFTCLGDALLDALDPHATR